jgi:hypothetical protein
MLYLPKKKKKKNCIVVNNKKMDSTVLSYAEGLRVVQERAQPHYFAKSLRSL